MVLAFSPSLFSFLCITVNLLKIACAQADDLSIYLNSSCTAKPQFSRGSLYESNLNDLLSNLTSISYSKNFNNISIGENSNRVYGLFLCSTDVDIRLCGNCIQSAKNDILQRCESSKEAIVWYNWRMIRYSNRNIFAINDVSIHYSIVLDLVGSKKYSRSIKLCPTAFLIFLNRILRGCLRIRRRQF